MQLQGKLLPCNPELFLRKILRQSEKVGAARPRLVVKVPNNPSTFDNRILSSKVELRLRERSWIEVVQLSKIKHNFYTFLLLFLGS